MCPIVLQEPQPVETPSTSFSHTKPCSAGVDSCNGGDSGKPTPPMKNKLTWGELHIHMWLLLMTISYRSSSSSIRRLSRREKQRGSVYWSESAFQGAYPVSIPVVEYQDCQYISLLNGLSGVRKSAIKESQLSAINPNGSVSWRFDRALHCWDLPRNISPRQ